MGNKTLILNTLQNSIKFINSTNTVDFMLHMDKGTGECNLSGFYEFTYPKVICFDVFRIQNMLYEAAETIYSYKQTKFRTIITKLAISIILEEFVIDKDKYNSKEEIREACYAEATRIIANNFNKTRRLIGSLDITQDAEIILNGPKFYKREKESEGVREYVASYYEIH